MKLSKILFITYLLILLTGCSKQSDNYVVAPAFVMPKSATKLTQFNNLYPTEHLLNQDIKLVKQVNDQELLPPDLG